VQLHLERALGARPLRLVALHHALVPAVVPSLGRIAGVLGRLLAGLGQLGLGHLAVGQFDLLHAMLQHGVAADVLACALVGLLPAIEDAPGDLLQPRQAAQLAHPLVGRLAVHGPRGLIAAGAGPGEHEQILAMPLAQGLAHGMPEVGVDRQPALRFLRRTGHVDRRGDQVLLLVPEEEHLQVVVLVALDAVESLGVGGAVHLGRAVGVDRAAILGDDGLALPPADLARPPLLPALGDRLGDSAGQKLHVLGRLHDAAFRQRVAALDRHRGIVRVRGTDEELVDVEACQTRPHLVAHLLQNPRTHGHQVPGDDDRLVEDLVPVVGLQGQGRGRDRRLDLVRDPQVPVAVQRDRLVRRDAHRGPADPEFRARRPTGQVERQREQRRDDESTKRFGPHACSGSGRDPPSSITG